jgi:hypothetical protein
LKIYIAHHNADDARILAETLIDAGHKVPYKWWDKPFKSEEKRAERNIEKVESADVLITESSDELVPGGKFVEIGAAIANLTPVILIGHQENLLMNHPGITQVSTVFEALELLNEDD